MSRNKFPEETVQKILEASKKLFLEKGYEETSVLDIVNNLGGLTRGAFYHHFKSKEEVLDALSDKLFFENNPFEQVKSEKGLTGLEKIKKIIKLQFQNQERQKLNVMSMSLLHNPKILAVHLENNQKIVASLFEQLFREGISDGSIKCVASPKAISSLFVLLTDVWCIPSIYPCTKEELSDRLYLIKDIFDKIDVPIMDEEILDHSKQILEKFNIN